MNAIDVRYFASLVDRTGTNLERLEIAPATTVEALWDSLTERHPALREIGYRPLVACDREYADWGRVLDGASEVAFLPPVSGG